MPTTSRGLVYPDSGANVELWTHLQNLATSADTAIGTAVAPGPFIKLILPANFSVSSGANTAVPFGASSEIIKTDASLHSTTVNTTRVTPNKAGIYELSVFSWWASNTSGQRGAHIGKNGGLQPPEQHWNATIPSGEFSIGQISTEHTANGTTDYFEMFVFQNSGGALNLMGGVGANRVSIFSMKYLRAS